MYDGDVDDSNRSIPGPHESDESYSNIFQWLYFQDVSILGNLSHTQSYILFYTQSEIESERRGGKGEGGRGGIFQGFFWELKY